MPGMEPFSLCALVSQLLVVVGALLKNSAQNSKRLQAIQEHLAAMQLALKIESVTTEARFREMALALQAYRAEVLGAMQGLECRLSKHVLEVAEKLRKDMQEERQRENEHLFYCVSDHVTARLQKLWYGLAALGALVLVGVSELTFMILR